MAKNQNVYRARMHRKERAGIAKKEQQAPAKVFHNAKWFKSLRHLAKLVGEELKFPPNGYLKGGHPPQYAVIFKNTATNEVREVPMEPGKQVKKEAGEVLEYFKKIGKGVPFRVHPNTIRGLYRRWKKEGPVMHNSEESTGATDSLFDNAKA